MSEVNNPDLAVGAEVEVEAVVPQKIRRKKRKKGEGCYKNEAKKRRSRGLSYEGNKGNMMAAKQPPADVVRIVIN